jgi:hypothetical protein
MRMRWVWCGGLLLLGLLLAGVGCGSPESAIEGVVTLDGKPVDKATVTFNQADGGGRPVAGVTNSDGVFKLSERIKSGTYKVTVSKREAADAGGPIDPSKPDQQDKMVKMMMGGKGKGPAPKSLLPEKYESAKTTPFDITIPHSGQVKLELASK